MHFCWMADSQGQKEGCNLFHDFRRPLHGHIHRSKGMRHQNKEIKMKVTLDFYGTNRIYWDVHDSGVIHSVHYLKKHKSWLCTCFKSDYQKNCKHISAVKRTKEMGI